MHDNSVINLDGKSLSIEQIVAVARRDASVRLSDDPTVGAAIQASFQLKEKLIEDRLPIYGVTTGFGDSVHRQISPEKAAALQTNMIQFLGCGTGAYAPVEIARATVLVRANCLARGHSAVRPEILDRLLDLLNLGITPAIREEGSVGASGDLVPLSYVAAALVGQRQVFYRGALRNTAEVLQELGLEPLTLISKEGLALHNGTSYMCGIAALAAEDARVLAEIADVCTAMATEVLQGIGGPFDPFIHDTAKPHPGQIQSASRIRYWLDGSKLVRNYDEVVRTEGEIGEDGYRELQVRIQDHYSIRCAPQFTGVLRDTLDWVWKWLTVEINSSNDNPLFDVPSGRVLSGGNFSGGHVGVAMDSLKTAVASVGDLLERQMELIVDEKFSAGLTPNLIGKAVADGPEAGLHHGFKGMQLACSSLVAEALNRCMPMTVFSRSTECHNQDKVSMGATSARHARIVVDLIQKAAAIHLLALCQAADLRGPERLGQTRKIYEKIRDLVPPLAGDREMDGDIEKVTDLIKRGELL